MTKTRKFWGWAFCVHALLFQAPSALAQSTGHPQYISDDVNVTIRDKPSNDAATVGAVKSGARVGVLESLGPDSFAHIRTADGREGWISARYLSEQPAARDQLNQLRQQFDQAHDQAQSLQHDLELAQQQLAKVKPELQEAGEIDKLRAGIAQREQQVSGLEQEFDTEQARRQTLLAGAALVGSGIAAGLILPLLGGGRKKRRNEL